MEDSNATGLDALAEAMRGACQVSWRDGATAPSTRPRSAGAIGGGSGADITTNRRLYLRQPGSEGQPPARHASEDKRRRAAAANGVGNLEARLGGRSMAAAAPVPLAKNGERLIVRQAEAINASEIERQLVPMGIPTLVLAGDAHGASSERNCDGTSGFATKPPPFCAREPVKSFVVIRPLRAAESVAGRSDPSRRIVQRAGDASAGGGRSCPLQLCVHSVRAAKCAARLAKTPFSRGTRSSTGGQEIVGSNPAVPTSFSLRSKLVGPPSSFRRAAHVATRREARRFFGALLGGDSVAERFGDGGGQRASIVRPH